VERLRSEIRRSWRPGVLIPQQAASHGATDPGAGRSSPPAALRARGWLPQPLLPDHRHCRRLNPLQQGRLTAIDPSRSRRLAGCPARVEPLPAAGGDRSRRGPAPGL